jgi:CO dehydrogenase nickel-insertion accessory protein CooC1
VALRIAELTDRLDNRIGHKHLFLNRCLDGDEKPLLQKVEQVMNQGGYGTLTRVPEDKELLRMDREEKSIFDLATESKVFSAIHAFLEKERLL